MDSVAGNHSKAMLPPFYHRLVILFVGILTAKSYFTEAKVFQVTRLMNETAVCAIDEPARVIGFDQPPFLSGNSDTCAPAAAQCALHCNLDDDCTNYNYREDLGRCELFHYIPTNCAVQPGCNHAQIKGLKSCRGPAVQRRTSDLSLPQTANVNKEKSTMTSLERTTNGGDVSTNPGLTEADCPADFQFKPEVKRCYLLLPEVVDWETAIQRCQDYYSGSYLVVVNSADEQNAIASYLSSKLTSCDTSGQCKVNSDAPVWISAQSTSSVSIDTRSCSYVWKPRLGEELPLTYSNWLPGEPVCFAGNYVMCAEIISSNNYSWDVVDCQQMLRPLCQCDPL